MLKLALSLSIFLCFTACKQNDELIKKQDTDIQQRIKDKTQTRELLQQLQDSGLQNPLKYMPAFIASQEMHTKTTTLVQQLQHIRTRIEDQLGEEAAAGDHAPFTTSSRENELAADYVSYLKDYNQAMKDPLYFFPALEKKHKKAFATNTMNSTADLDPELTAKKAIPLLLFLSQKQQEAVDLEFAYLKAIANNPESLQ